MMPNEKYTPKTHHVCAVCHTNCLQIAPYFTIKQTLTTSIAIAAEIQRVCFLLNFSHTA